MAELKNSNKPQLDQQFWAAYEQCAEENHVTPDKSRFYAVWARKFAGFIPEKHISERTGAEVEAFLADLAQQEKIAPWQVKQAESALRLLYDTFLPRYRPVAPEVADSAESGETPDPTRFRDRVIPGEVERRYAKHLRTLETEIRSRHYSYRTETTYLEWVRRFIAFHGYADPLELDAAKSVKAYLDYLAVERDVAASTQNQALNALVFFYEQAFRKPFGEMGEFTHAKRPKRLPEVLTKSEVQRLLAGMEGVPALMAGLMYGGGLRLMECVRLRVKDVDFEKHQIMVRDGKGGKDRVTMLPKRYAEALREHLGRMRAIHNEDLAAGHGEAYLWPSLSRKYPNAAQGVGLAVRVSRRKAVGGPARRRGPAAPHQRVAPAEGGEGRGAEGRPDQAGELSHAPALVRHAPARGRLRHPHRPGTARALGCVDHHDLYACPEQAGPGCQQPCGWVTASNQ